MKKFICKIMPIFFMVALLQPQCTQVDIPLKGSINEPQGLSIAPESITAWIIFILNIKSSILRLVGH